MGTTRGNRIMALSRVVSPVCGHRTNVPIVGDLGQQFRHPSKHDRMINIGRFTGETGFLADDPDEYPNRRMVD